MSRSSERALAALERGANSDAIAIARDAVAAGDADAQHLLALWHMVGSHVRRDLPEARRLLRLAVQQGHEEASLIEVSLTANGSGAAPDWPAAVALLRQAADRFGGVAREDIALIDALDLDDRGYPVRLPDPEIIGTGYTVKRWRGFLAPQECAHIAMAVTDILAPSSVADPRTGRLISHPIRTSSAAVVGPTRETLPIQAILRRVALASGTEVAQGEPLTILHYAPGQQYRDHLDTLPHEGNQRIRTALMYLNSGYVGGETRFPLEDLAVAGGGGDAVVFENVLPGTEEPDPRSRHASVPIRQGSKWAATRWIRARPIDVWNLG